MARYFTLVENDHRTEKNALDKAWMQLIYANNRRILESDKEREAFKKMLYAKYDEILKNNPRCKKRELQIFFSVKGERVSIYLPGQGTIVIYKEQEVTNG